MKQILTLMTIAMFGQIHLSSQEETLEIEGAILIGDSQDPTPDPGTIRWTGSDFEGRDSTSWLSLSGGRSPVRDIDQNVYETVVIGNQTWMAENLRVVRFNDSTAISFVPVLADWIILDTPGYCTYFNQHTDYGVLYNFEVLDTSNGKNICPLGWHLPTDSEWDTLANFLGGASVAGGKMKEAGILHWNNPNVGATNQSKFRALPGGYRRANGFFSSEGTSGLWWSSTLDGVDNAFSRTISKSSEAITRSSESVLRGQYIRCVKD